MALAFFDPNVKLEQKREMVGRLQFRDPIVELLHDRKLKRTDILFQYNLSDFVSHNTTNFFIKFEFLLSEFLELDPSEWESDDEFLVARAVCRDLFVVNDTAERGVKFMKDYNIILTNDEHQKQLLQIVEEYRKNTHHIRN